MSQMHAIPCLKDWYTAIISEVRENEEDAMFLICWHAISLITFDFEDQLHALESQNFNAS